MKKIATALSFLSFAVPSSGQGWTAYAGAGVGYDAFLRDKTVVKNKVSWPFQVGATILAGGSYYTQSGFNIFCDVNVGLLRIQFPEPDAGKSQNHYELGYARLMAGSGPRIDVGNKGNFITPFIQLGAMRYNPFGSDGVGSDDRVSKVVLRDSANTLTRWVALCGAGIDWQFNALVPSSINFQIAYTPLNLFTDPLKYTVTSKSGSYDLDLQGKLLQVMLSYKVHFFQKRTER